MNRLVQGQHVALEHVSFLGRSGNTLCFKHTMKMVLFNSAQPYNITICPSPLLMVFLVGESFAGV